MADLDRVETANLVLRRIGAIDRPFLERMWQDPDVVVTLGGPRDADAVGAVVDRWQAHWDREGYGAYVMSDRATGETIGWVGLMRTDTGGDGGTELLYALAPAWRGRGLVTEAGGALLDVAFGPLGLGSVVAFTQPGNRASRAVMERLGFRYECDIEHAGLPHVLYRRWAAGGGAVDAVTRGE